MSTVFAVVAAAMLAAQEAPPAPRPAPAPAPAPAARPAPARPNNTVEAVVVTGAQAEVRTSIDRRSYSLGKDIAAGTGSIADALRNVPGVEVDLQGALTVRGDANVTIQIDGKPAPQFQGAARADALQQLPADQIERVEVVTTPSAANDPEGSGGIINLVMKQSRGAGTTGSAFTALGTAGTKRVGGTFGYNSRKMTVSGNLASSYQRNKAEVDILYSLPEPGTGAFADHRTHNRGRNLTRVQNGGLNLGYDLTPKDRLSGGVTYSSLLLYGYPTNYFEDRNAAGTLVAFQDRFNKRRFTSIDSGVTGGWRHTFGDGHTLSVDALSNSSRWNDYNLWTTRNAYPAVIPLESNNLFGAVHHSELKSAYVRPFEGGKLSLGYELKTDDNRYDAEVARGPTVPLMALDKRISYGLDYEQTINVAYATFERPFGDVTVQGGLRLENTVIDIGERTTQVAADQDYFRAFPTLNVAYKLDDQNKLTFNYGRRIQRPPAFLLTPFRVYVDPKNFQQGNPNLEPQETQVFEAAYEKRRNGAYYLATAYYRSNENEFSPVLINQGGGVVLSTFDNLGSSRSAGLELVANGKLATNLTYSATSNLFWTRIDASNLGVGGGERSATGIGGRFNVNWQARPKDALQLNLQATPKRLYAQGETDPIYTVNLGWRHKLTDKLTLTTSVQDLLNTNRFRREFSTPIYRDWAEQRGVTRAVLLRLDYRFSSGAAAARPAADPAFEYGGAAPAP